MQAVPILDVLCGKIKINTEITVQGWVRTRRDSKAGFSFLSIYDGSSFDSLQAIIYNSLPTYETEILHLTTGCSIVVSGIIINSPGKKQLYEIKTKSLKVIGWVEKPSNYPLAPKQHTPEFLREIAHLRPRTNLIGAITRVRHTTAQALHRFLDKKGFLWISTPLITSTDTEGAGKMFRVSTLNFNNLPYTSDGKIDFQKDFFAKETFLTVSGQLTAETYACALSKIYTFGPTFRAENSNTSRHLSEFWMLEPESAFSDLNDVIELAELMLKYVFKKVLEKRIDDMNFLFRQKKEEDRDFLRKFINIHFEKIEYTEAINILKVHNQKFEKKISWGMDLSSEHERYLTEKYFKAPVIIKNYPKDIKPFYMRLNEDNKTVAAMDILIPGIGEIIGGSQREERLNILDNRLENIGKFKKEEYWWYRDLRRYGTVPHSGFGLGFERLVSFITGIKNIKDISPFPRTVRNANF